MLIFWVVSGVKRQKMAQSEKKNCLFCFISQEPYIIWLSFMVIVVSPGDFLGFNGWGREGKRAEKDP